MLRKLKRKQKKSASSLRFWWLTSKIYFRIKSLHVFELKQTNNTLLVANNKPTPSRHTWSKPPSPVVMSWIGNSPPNSVMFGGMRFRCMALFMQLYKSLHYEEKNAEKKGWISSKVLQNWVKLQVFFILLRTMPWWLHTDKLIIALTFRV